MDEFAILLLARMFHRHFGIVLRDYVWTTGIGITIEDCSILFAYTGDLQFMDTYELQATPVKTSNALKFTDPDQETPVNLSVSQDNVDNIDNKPDTGASKENDNSENIKPENR